MNTEALYERRKRRWRPVLYRMVVVLGAEWVIHMAVEIEVAKRVRLRTKDPWDPGLGRLELERALAEELMSLLEAHNFSLPLPRKRNR